MIIARGAFEIRVRFVVGTRRRKRRTQEMARRNEIAASAQSSAKVWPPDVEIGPAFIAEHVAIAHALRREEMRQMLLRFFLGNERR